MKDMIDRLSKLIGSDREIDGELMQIVDHQLWTKAYRLAQEPCGCSKEMATEEAKLRAPPYTASVDATIALAERVLPGKGIDLLREAISELGKKYHWHICLKKPEQVKELPIQVCIAILRAKEVSK